MISKQIKFITLLYVLLFIFVENSNAQVFDNTYDVIHNTKYIRKKQTAHSIQNVQIENNNIIINLTATLDKKLKRKPYHIMLSIDSILSYYKDTLYFKYEFDSLTTDKYNVHSLEKRYTNKTKYHIAAGVDIMCRKEILKEGYYNGIDTLTAITDSVEILTNSEEYPYVVNERLGIYLQGEHIVMLYYFGQPKKVEGGSLDYAIINIENSPKVKKGAYLKLPFVFIADLVLSPVTYLLSRGK